MPTPDLVRLALALIAAEEAERAIRLRLLACARARDHVALGAFEVAHAKARERVERAEERLRAVYRAVAEHYAPVLVCAVMAACSA